MSTATVVQPDIKPTVANLVATTDQKSLTEALAFLIATALPSKCQLPVLTGALIEGTNGALVASAFDYEVSASERFAGEGVGRVLVPGRLLQDIVKSMTKGCSIKLAVVSDRLTITGDGVTYTVPVLPLDEFPELPPLPEAVVCSLGVDQVAGICDVAVAAGRDDTLPALTALRFEPSTNVKDSIATLVVAATDRYRLAVYDTGVTVKATLDPFLLPAKTVVMVRKSFKRTVTLSVTPGKGGDKIVAFDDGTRRLTARNIDSEFPKYRSLLPDEFATTVVVDVKALVKGVRQVALVAARTSPVRLVVDGGITLQAGGLDEAEASTDITAEHQGEPFTIAFNPAYLLDGLSAAGSDTVSIKLLTPTKPAVLSGVDRPEFRYLLMPVRLAG